MITAIRNTAAAIRNAASNLIWSSTKGTTNRGTGILAQGTADIGTATRIVGYGAATTLNTSDTGAATQGIVRQGAATQDTIRNADHGVVINGNDSTGTADQGAATHGTKNLKAASQSISPINTATPTRYAKIYPTVYRDSRLTKTDHRVYGFICTYRNERTGVGYPSVPTIAAGIGVDERHVRRSLRQLEKFGWLLATGETKGRGVVVYAINNGLGFCPQPTSEGADSDPGKNGQVEPTGGGRFRQGYGGQVSPAEQRIVNQRKNNNSQPLARGCGDPTVVDDVVVSSPAAQTATATTADTTDVVVFVSSFVQASTNGSATATLGISNSVSGSGTPKPAPAPVAAQRVAHSGDTASVQAVTQPATTSAPVPPPVATKPVLAKPSLFARPIPAKQPVSIPATAMAKPGFVPGRPATMPICAITNSGTATVAAINTGGAMPVATQPVALPVATPFAPAPRQSVLPAAAIVAATVAGMGATPTVANNGGAMPAAPRQPALTAAATVANNGTATVAKPTQATPVQPWPADLPVNAGENIDRFLADLLDKDAQYPNDRATVRAEILATFEAKLDEIGNPVGYAQRMILVAKRGAFCPTYAKKKAIEEDSKAFFARQRQKEAEEEARRDAESADREAKIAAIRAAAGEHRLEDLRQRFIAGLDSMNRSRIVLNESDFRFKILFDCFLLKQVQNG